MIERKKPDLSKGVIGINPFSQGLEIFITKRVKKTFNKFGDEDVKEVEYEATPYTKVFGVEGARKQVCELPLRGKELYLDIIHAIQSAQDIIWIDRDDYMRRMRITSLNTYKSAVRGLCDNAYIMKHQAIKDAFWINPHFFFKGSRLSKYPNKIFVKNLIDEDKK